MASLLGFQPSECGFSFISYKFIHDSYVNNYLCFFLVIDVLIAVTLPTCLLPPHVTPLQPAQSLPGCGKIALRRWRLQPVFVGQRLARLPAQPAPACLWGECMCLRFQDKSRVLIPGVTGQIPELLKIAVKLHRHHYR